MVTLCPFGPPLRGQKRHICCLKIACKLRQMRVCDKMVSFDPSRLPKTLDAASLNAFLGRGYAPNTILNQIEIMNLVKIVNQGKVHSLSANTGERKSIFLSPWIRI